MSTLIRTPVFAQAVENVGLGDTDAVTLTWGEVSALKAVLDSRASDFSPVIEQRLESFREKVHGQITDELNDLVTTEAQRLQSEENSDIGFDVAAFDSEEEEEEEVERFLHTMQGADQQAGADSAWAEAENEGRLGDELGQVTITWADIIALEDTWGLLNGLVGRIGKDARLAPDRAEQIRAFAEKLNELVRPYVARFTEGV